MGYYAFRYLISIHALREEGDLGLRYEGDNAKVFLSTPSARRATEFAAATEAAIPFLSTPSARRATLFSNRPVKAYSISIHALREEGDSSAPA